MIGRDENCLTAIVNFTEECPPLSYWALSRGNREQLMVNWQRPTELVAVPRCGSRVQERSCVRHKAIPATDLNANILAYVVPVQVVTFKHAVDEGLAPRLQRRDADPGDSAKKSRVQGQPLNVLEFSGENYFDPPIADGFDPQNVECPYLVSMGFPAERPRSTSGLPVAEFAHPFQYVLARSEYLDIDFMDPGVGKGFGCVSKGARMS